MTKRLSHDLTYDASLEAVAAMLADPAFRERVCEEQGAVRQSVEIEGDATDGGMVVTIDQILAADGIPSFAKKFVGDEINIVQRETWNSPASGDIDVTIPGKPGDMAGTATLREAGGKVTETVTLDIKVGIPLVGGKIGGLIADLLLKALKSENRTGRDYLSG